MLEHDEAYVSIFSEHAAAKLNARALISGRT